MYILYLRLAVKYTKMDYGTVFLILIIFVIVIGLAMYYKDHKSSDDGNVHEMTEEQRSQIEVPVETS